MTTAIFYKIADGTETTITLTGVGANIRLNIFEYSGGANPAVTDGVNQGTATTATTITTSAITTTAANDLIIAAVASGASITAGSSSFNAPFTRIAESFNPVRLFVGDSTTNTAGSNSATASWTTSVTTFYVIAGFKAAGAPSTTTGGTLSLMGVG